MIEIIGFLTKKELIDNFTIGLVGLAAILLRRIFVILYDYLNNILFSYRNFTISGIWLAGFLSYISGKHNYELVRITHDKENIRLYIEQYNNLTNSIFKFGGNGVFRASKMSAVYYPLDRSEIRSGVFALRTINTPNGEIALTGRYAEFESNENGETLRIADTNYSLKRIKLPLIKSIKMKLHIPSFKNYDDLKAYLSKNKYDAVEPAPVKS